MNAAIQTLRYSTRLTYLRSLCKPLLTLVILGSIAVAAIKLNQHGNLTQSLSSYAFASATLLAIVYRLVNPLGWTLALRSMGYRVDPVAATMVWLRAESRRWLPGGIWGYTSRAVQSKQLGVPVGVASASMLVELLVTMAAAIFAGLIGLALYFDQLSAPLTQWSDKLESTAMCVAVAAGGLIFLGVFCFTARRKLSRKFTSLVEKLRHLRSIKINPGRLSTSLGYMVLMAILNGTVNLALLDAVAENASVPFPVMVGATATAWVIGFLAFFSPGGILVRESALAALLLPWLPTPTGIALALLSRFAQLIAEVVCMLLLTVDWNRLRLTKYAS